MNSHLEESIFIHVQMNAQMNLGLQPVKSIYLNINFTANIFIFIFVFVSIFIFIFINIQNIQLTVFLIFFTKDDNFLILGILEQLGSPHIFRVKILAQIHCAFF